MLALRVGLTLDFFISLQPLHSIGEHDNVKKLVIRGLDVNIQDKAGKTGLHLAIEANQERIVYILLQAHANSTTIHDQVQWFLCCIYN